MPDLPWFVYAFPLAMVGVIAVAAIYKWLQVRAAADWPQATGKVVVSTSIVRKVKTFDHNRAGGRGEEERNFAHVVYEYTVGGERLRNDRVSIGEDLGNFEVAETIARYPVGKIVTVYYNPRTPKDAVLERDAPKGVFGCVIWMVVLGVAGILGSFYGFNQITIYLTERVQNAPMVVALSAMGGVALLFGLALFRHGAAARNWPRVSGRITRSEVDEFLGRIGDKSALTTLYRPLIAFAYEYNGVKYSGSHTSLGAQVTSNTAAFAKKAVAKFPAGKTIQVYVNPANPSEAMLKPGTGSGWFVLAIGAGLLGLAYFVSQH
jgi:hypothetical protein